MAPPGDQMIALQLTRRPIQRRETYDLRDDGRGPRAMIGVGRTGRLGRHAQLGVRLCVSRLVVRA